MLHFEINRQDFRAIEEALLESSFHWQSAADRTVHTIRLLMGDPSYASKLEGLKKERANLEHIVRRRRGVLARLQKQKEAGTCTAE